MKTKIFTLLLLALPFLASAQTLTIESGAVVTIGPGGAMTTGAIINNNGVDGLVIKSDATGTGSLIYDGTSGNPEATVETYISKNAQHFVSSPVNPGNSSSYYYGDEGNFDAWLWWWDHTVDNDDDPNWADPWVSVISLDSTLRSGQGFTTAWTDGQGARVEGTAVHQGTLVGESLEYYFDPAETTPPSTYFNPNNGFHLLGNPFTAAIDLSPFVGQPDGGFEITVWIWDQTQNGGLGAYVWGSVNNSYPGNEMTVPHIPIGQAFFMRQLTDAIVGVNYNADYRTHSTVPFYKKSAEKAVNEDLNYAWIIVESGILKDKVLIGFDENGTDGFENGWDASKLFNGENLPAIYFKDNTDWPLCQNNIGYPEEDQAKVVTLYTSAGVEGDHTISVDVDNLRDIRMTLEDRQTDVWTDLDENTTYSYYASKDDDIDRFRLHLSYSPTSVDDPFATREKAVDIYSWDKAVYIHSDENDFAGATISIFDMYGRQIYSQKATLGGTTRIPLDVSNSYLVVRVQKENTLFTEKVFIK